MSHFVFNSDEIKKIVTDHVNRVMLFKRQLVVQLKVKVNGEKLSTTGSYTVRLRDV